MKFFFIGQHSEYDGVAFKRYGQAVEMPEDKAEALIAEHPPALLIPEYLWNNIGFSTEDLAKYHSTMLHGEAPQEFKDKTAAARQAWHDYREELIAKKNVENHVIPEVKE